MYRKHFICTIEGCERKHECKGYCAMHYFRFKKHGDANHVPFSIKKEKEKCLAKDCVKIGRGRGYCYMHYRRLMKHGDINFNPIFIPKKCKYSGCDKHAKAKGFCTNHYSNLRLKGTPDTINHPQTVFEAFLKKVYPIGEGCWLWMGYLYSNGYGCVNFKRKGYLAHRISYMHFKGPIDSNREIMHSCQNRSCINPNHLSLGTHQQNMAEMKLLNRHAHGERAGGSKLTEKEVIEILTLLEDDIKISVIAKIYNVSNCTISDIKHRRSWKHVQINEAINEY